MQEIIAIGIVGLTFLVVALRVVLQHVVGPVSAWLLQRGHVKWAFFVRKQGMALNRFFFHRCFFVGLISSALFPVACTSLPTPQHKKYVFPAREAFVQNVKREYYSLGYVRSKVDFQTLDPNSEEDDLCRNYYNRSVRELVKFGKDKGGDAVINVRSIVFFRDGTHKLFVTPECSDDGMEGQILTQGQVIQWKDSLYAAPK